MRETSNTSKPLRSFRNAALCYGVATLCLLAGCSALAKATYLELLPMQGFDTLPADARVHFEPGAQAAAEKLATNYNSLVEQVQSRLGDALRSTPQVYLCATDACYRKYALSAEARAEARGRGNLVLLNAATLESENRLLPVFAHELVHVFWFQRGVHCTPRWWTEGLAVATSDGGGAEKAAHDAAVQAIRDGRAFQASSENSCWTRMPLGLDAMPWPMFYRQSGMFVQWLRATHPEAFAASLARLRSGENLATAIESTHGQPLSALQRQWRKSLE
jgi:hypothetical protein